MATALKYEPTPAQEQIWAEIELAAHAQVSAEIESEVGNPLAWGEHVAWSLLTPRVGITDGISPIHRVGYRIGGQEGTICGELIPDPVRRVALGAGMIRSAKKDHALEPCGWCAKEYVRQLQESRVV